MFCFRPPNHMYYPPAPGYPPHMPPPRPQMPSHPPQPPMQQPMPNMQQPPQYRPPMQSAPRQTSMPRQNLSQPQRGPMSTRQPLQPRQRMPTVRARGQVPVPMRAPRPRMAGLPMTVPQNGQVGPRMMKRTPEQIQALQAKRKRMDVLMPDKHDDADCQVIAVQPKNTGLPQIQSVQVSTIFDFLPL